MVEINRSQSGNTRRESGLKNLMRDDKPVLAISGERVKDTRQLLVSLRRRRMHDFLHVSLSEADQEKLHVFEPIWITMSKDRKLGRGSASYIGISDMELAIRFSSAIIERIKDSSLVEILAKTISRFEHDQVRLRLLSIAAVQDINTLDKIVAVFSKSNSVKLINSFGDQDIAVKMSGEVEAMLYHSSSTGNARKIVDYLAGRMGEQELDQVESVNVLRLGRELRNFSDKFGAERTTELINRLKSYDLSSVFIYHSFETIEKLHIIDEFRGQLK